MLIGSLHGCLHRLTLSHGVWGSKPEPVQDPLGAVVPAYQVRREGLHVYWSMRRSKKGQRVRSPFFF